MSNFRWFSDDKTEAVRMAKQHSKKAHEDLSAYGEHQQETRPRGCYETPEYYRLNKIAYDAHQNVRKTRGW
jgi:hypothetical protein